jgi:microsomal dipeptidase-like Zn-dependent dipeptidase
VIDDVLAMASAPVVVSHTGVCGTHESPRNLSDAHVRGTAATGGVMGIEMFDGAVTVPVDASGLALLTEELLDQRFAEGEIRAIMGGNALRVLAGVLPAS